jgi:hypothetical protein
LIKSGRSVALLGRSIEAVAFVAFVVANTVSDSANAIQRLLPDFCACPAFYGKAFAVELDQQGKPTSVTTCSSQSASTYS